MGLRPYQEDLYKKAQAAFLQGKRRVLIVAPCGAGKSYIFCEMAKNCPGEVLVLTHRQELLRQHRDLIKGMGLHNVRIEMVITEAHHMAEHQPPKLLIVDEAHLSNTNTWASVVRHYDTATVGFTATPVRLDGRPLGDIYDDLIQGVDVKWLIAHNYLAPVRYYAPLTVDVEKVRISRWDFNGSDLEYVMGNQAIYGDVIQSVKAICAHCRQIIAYCVSLKHGDLVKKSLTEAGIPAETINSKMIATERARIMDRFRKGEFRVLCNVGIISEGVSLDNVDCCLLLRPTMSHALYWQQAMRCMRYQPGKQAMILDFVGNYTRNPLPDEEVKWELNNTPRKKERVNGNGDFSVRVCPSCYRTFATAPKCPYCGNDYPLHPREIEAHENIRLAEIAEEEKQRVIKERKKMRREVGQARTYAELLKIAHDRGYKPAWARMVWNNRKR